MGGGKDNAEAQRERRCRAGLGVTVNTNDFRDDFTTADDSLSSYLLCGNDSNGADFGRKLVRGMGMGGSFAWHEGVF
jgi:hypothetical protein